MIIYDNLGITHLSVSIQYDHQYIIDYHRLSLFKGSSLINKPWFIHPGLTFTSRSECVFYPFGDAQRLA